MRFSRNWLLALFFVFSFATANEYPTVDTVRFVVDCMAANGGQNEENLYACTCRFDKINSALTFAEYEQVSVYLRNKDMPGEKGGVFRAFGRTTRELRDKFDQVAAEAVSACPIPKRVVLPAKK